MRTQDQLWEKLYQLMKSHRVEGCSVPPFERIAERDLPEVPSPASWHIVEEDVALQELETMHRRSCSRFPIQGQDSRPIVVVELEDRLQVLDGNNRVNQMHAEWGGGVSACFRPSQGRVRTHRVNGTLPQLHPTRIHRRSFSPQALRTAKRVFESFFSEICVACCTPS